MLEDVGVILLDKPRDDEFGLLMHPFAYLVPLLCDNFVNLLRVGDIHRFGDAIFNNHGGGVL